MDALAAFHFLRPQWLLLVVPYALIFLWERRRNDQATQWRPVIAEHLLKEMIVPGDSRGFLSPETAARAIGVLLALSLAGPSWQRGESPYAEDSAALVIAIDLSASMAEKDVQPSRLQRARDKVLQLATSRGDAYTALVAYAGSAHTVLPLSNDSNVLVHYLDALRVGMLPREGKAPENVISLTRQLLADKGRGGTLLLVGDGAANESAAAFEVLTADSTLQLLVWGIGKTQAAIDADAERGLRSDTQPLQETQLKAIAVAAGGHYQRLTVNDDDLKYLARRIDRHYLSGSDSSRPWIDAGYYLLLPITVIFLMFFRRGWVLRW